MQRRLLVCGALLVACLGQSDPGGAAPWEMVLPDGGRGTGYPRGEPLDHHAEEWRAATAADLDAAVSALQERGVLRSPQKAAGVLFRWPVRLVPGHPDPSGYTINTFVDHDPATGQVRDWNCGVRTYDNPDGYNHPGTDIGSFPYRWLKMDNEENIVVAAADGVIVRKDDGNFDRNCDRLNPQGPANAIYIRHADGSIAWYLHFKKNTLTTKRVGDRVDAGEFLGSVGSSGGSTAPHLHFEVHDASGKVIDPFAGACNTSNPDSWWVSQPPYWDPAILRLAVSTALADTTACGVAEVTHVTNYVASGSTAYFNFHLRDFRKDQVVQVNVLRPDGTLFATRTLTNTQQDFVASSWFYPFTFATAEAPGTWAFRVTFAGQTQTVPFTVGGTEPVRTTITEFFHSGFQHYFITGTAAEAAALDQGRPAGWTRTGASYPGYAAGAAGQNPVCRFFWTPPPDTPSTHFYTVIASECAIVKAKPDWTFEENAFASLEPSPAGQCPANTRPLYRIYNNGQRGSPNHRYTSSFATINVMESQGWLLEGAVMCLPQ